MAEQPKNSVRYTGAKSGDFLRGIRKHNKDLIIQIDTDQNATSNKAVHITGNIKIISPGAGDHYEIIKEFQRKYNDAFFNAKLLSDAIMKRTHKGKQLVLYTGLLVKEESHAEIAPESDNHIDSSQGAGFGDHENNEKVELAAITITKKYYEDDGWEVDATPQDGKCGYDLRCTKSGQEKHVEVKGISGTDLSFIITANEVEQARNNQNFELCVITSALEQQPVIHIYPKNELESKFDLRPISYRATLK